MGLALHPQVIEDLDAIHAEIFRVDPVAAGEALDKLVAALDSLSRMPLKGDRRPDLTSHPLRFKMIGEYLVAYMPERETLWIVAVIDRRRSPRVIAAILRPRN